LEKSSESKPVLLRIDVGAGLLSGIIEWAANGFWTLVQHMGVDHSCFYIFMPKQLLHGADA
jgi:hypothetical protein